MEDICQELLQTYLSLHDWYRLHLLLGIALYALVAHADAYTVTMRLMGGLLAMGLLCNLAVREVDPRHHAEEAAA